MHVAARRGFTLLEVIVALGVLAVIGVMSFTAMSNSLQAREFLEEDQRFARNAETALNRVSRQLELAWLTEHTTAVNTFQTVFVGKDGDDLDEVWFASLGHQRRYRESREGDQTEITLWTEEDPENEGDYVLLMREAQRIDEKPDEDGVITPLAHGVRRFELRYLDPSTGEWTDDWDTTGADQPNRLPRAVTITLVLSAPDPDDPEATVPVSFVRTVRLAFAKTLNREAAAWSNAIDAEDSSSSGGAAGGLTGGRNQ
ncbi:MAG: prepilin-type N-terminal cleavage/methylation domain-containing protein [Alphaproteobacteria bacterium]|nr:prepilin-type N-terminal cleavage/methylation domain-containing protein [Alphaproteobacteria bacterium]